jgi:hypothetical protein
MEILETTAEEACLKKERFLKLISILSCEVKRGFVDP